MTEKPIAVLYEHPEWFEPLFEELERRNVHFEKLWVRDHFYDPSVRQSPYALIVNRVSAYPSGGSRPEIVLYVKQYLAYLEGIQVRVINGYFSYLVGTSKATQLGIFERLGLCYPKARIIHHPKQAVAAAAGLAFPVLVKPNVGGSGAGILRFYSLEELEQVVNTQHLDLGIDHTALVQEYVRAKGGFIVRVEILDGEFLYAIRLPIAEDSFNYCPADGCSIGNPDLAVEGYTPPHYVMQTVKSVLAAAQVDLGSVEYLVSEVDDQIYYYDINPLSNFVANGVDVVGFDPTARFVDYLLDRAGS